MSDSFSCYSLSFFFFQSGYSSSNSNICQKNNEKFYINIHKDKISKVLVLQDLHFCFLIGTLKIAICIICKMTVEIEKLR